MAETILIDAATVAAGDPSDVVAVKLVHPQIQFRVSIDQTYGVAFYVADSDFSDVADAFLLDAYSDTGSATSGTVYAVDAGAYDYAACVVTNTSLSEATLTVAGGWDVQAEAASALFTVAEARSWDKAQLSSDTDYTDAVIIAAEASIRERLSRWCGRFFLATSVTNEYHSGDGSALLVLRYPDVQSVTAASVRSDDDWTALTADQLASIRVVPEATDTVYYEDGYWPRGVGSVRVTYTAGLPAVPEMVKRAALDMVVDELCVSNVPWQADSYDAGNVNYSWSRADGYNGAWSSLPSVMAAVRMYSLDAGIA